MDTLHSDVAIGSEQAGTTSPEVELDSALREIATLEAPADVDEEVFEELKAELTRLLATGHSSDGFSAAYIHVQCDPLRSSSEAEIWDSSMDDYEEHLNRPAISFSGSDTRITAEYCADGDYDQNGVVNAADLVPLAINIGKSPGWNRLLRHIDGDRNGSINIADIVPIARNYGASPEMLLYGSTDLRDYPWQGTDASQIDPLSADPPQESETSESGLRQFTFTGFASKPEMFYWVGTANSGRVSQICYDPLLARYVKYDGLSYDPQKQSISYDEIAVGDSDRNSEVNASDIDDWALYFSLSYTDPEQSPFLASLDFNRDGHIGATDVVSLPMYYGAWRPTVMVYVTMEESELPENTQIPVDSGPEPYTQFTPHFLENGRPQQKDFASYEEYELALSEWNEYYNTKLPDSKLWRETRLEGLPSGAWLWLRPVVKVTGSSEQVLGYPSEVIRIP
ncbi:MAG: hypothetical protein R3F46_01345 [bacterium]